MADIVDLSSLIRRDDNVVDVDALGEVHTDERDRADEGDILTFGPSPEDLLDFGAQDDRAGGRRARPRINPSLDWSNQELADLYRVQRLLGQAGIGVDTDRGVTDEGDPWFVFLDAQGEVFVHLSRIDGLYFLDSAVQDEVVTGPCFASLIERFAGRAEAAAAVRPDGATILNMNRRGKIVMHPGAALAALVWSILLVTDGLVFLEEPVPGDDEASNDHGDRLAQEGDGAPAPEDGGDLDVAGSAADAAPTAFEELFVDKSQAATFLSGVIHEREAGERSGPGDMRDTAHFALAGTSSAASSIAMTGIGLTALAAAYGINRTQNAAEPLEDVEAAEIVVASADDDLTMPDAVEAAADDKTVGNQAAAGHVFASDAPDLHDVDGSYSLAQGEPAVQHAAVDPEMIAAELAQTEADVPPQGVEIAANTQADHSDAQTPATPDTGPADAARMTNAQGQSSSRLTDLLESVGLDDLLDGDETPIISAGSRVLEGAEELFRLVDQGAFVVALADTGKGGEALVNARTATPDMIARSILADNQGMEPEIATIPGPPDPVLEFAAFTDDVRNYIDHIILNSDIEVIALENQLLLIDLRALEEAGAEAYAMTWSLDEERVISTIGVKADFEAFDLIA